MSGLVKVFRSSDSGAPNVLNNAAGTLITVLDACLVNGYGSVTLDSLVVSGGVATATKSTGHGFAVLGSGTGTLGPVVLIAGATPAGLNGEHRIAVTSATAFTFTTAEANGTATGTITAKIAPVGWAKAYSGTNKAVYRPADTTRVRPFLRVRDDMTTQARFNMYEEMSDVDTGTGMVPTTDVGYHYKASGATVVPWMAIADGNTIHFLNSPAAFNYGGFSFGCVLPFFSSDLWSAYLANQANGSSYFTLAIGDDLTAKWWLRNYSGTTLAQAQKARFFGTAYAAMSESDPPLSGVRRVYPGELWESAVGRATLPGMLSYQSAGSNNFTPHTLQIAGRNFIRYPLSTSGGAIGAVFDLDGPWD